MDETVVGEDGTAPRPGAVIGERLRVAREQAGLSLADVASRTRVPLRHLEAVERGDYETLPSQTYAIGFARAFARTVGIDEVETAAAVRAELAQHSRPIVGYAPYEMPDPARVPSRRLAILGAGVALALLILAALWFGTDLLRGRDDGAETGPAPAATTVAAIPAPTATPTAVSGGQVRLTANDEVWLRVYDADNKTLFLGTMKPGDHFDVPQDAKEPMINVGRPEKLAVTLNGAAVPPLGSGDHAIKDVKVSGAAMAARLAGAPAPTASPSAAPSSTASSVAADEHHDDKPRRKKRVLTETQRANLDSPTPPPASNGN